MEEEIQTYGSNHCRGQLKNRVVLIDALLLSMPVVEKADTIIGTRHQPVLVSLTKLNPVCLLSTKWNRERREMSPRRSQLEAEFYFAYPFASDERGLNGLIRQYCPQGKDFTTIAEEEINRVWHGLNNLSRKCLEFQTPNQVFYGESSTLHLLLESTNV